MTTPNVITEPAVYLVGRQQIDAEALARFLGDHDVATWETDTAVAGQKLVEVAGRLCYMSFAKPRPGGNAAYVAHILEVGHGSVLEHAVFNLIITGVSRSFSHELIRHRAGFGYSQISQRFVDESGVSFVVPPALAREVSAAGLYLESVDAQEGDPYFNSYYDPDGNPYSPEEVRAGLRWVNAVRESRMAYKSLSDYLYRKELDTAFAAAEERVEAGGDQSNKYAAWLADQDRDRLTGFRKAAREAARSVLPNATETKLFVTGNARALRHFIEMRADPAADAEIRRVAVVVLRVLVDAAPNLFGDYEIVPTPAGDLAAKTPHRKV